MRFLVIVLCALFISGAANAQSEDSSITVTATDTAWLEIRDVSNQVLVSKIFQTGEKYIVPPTVKGAILDTGNAMATALTMDGETYPVGFKNEIRRAIPLTPDYFYALKVQSGGDFFMKGRKLRKAQREREIAATTPDNETDDPALVSFLATHKQISGLIGAATGCGLTETAADAIRISDALIKAVVKNKIIATADVEAVRSMGRKTAIEAQRQFESSPPIPCADIHSQLHSLKSDLGLL